MKYEKLQDFYQNCMYGQWRHGENVSYELNGDELTIFVSAGSRKASYTVGVKMPDAETKAAALEKFGGKIPFIVCMHPIQPVDYICAQGYGVFTLNTLAVASDDCKHNGAFYELYPYSQDPLEQTGVLMAWGWAASKVLDACEAGLADALQLDMNASMVTGVSRWGKATAVCGAFEKRFTVVIPTCSGAGGLALNNFISEGKTYNFEQIGGPKEYKYGQNEPLSCLQSEAERGWFNDYYLSYEKMADIPFEQYMLPVMAADSDRFYYIVAACMGEDWVNAPAMWECYKKANELYEEMGLADHLIAHFHKEGHAVLQEDMEFLIPYFNKMHYGILAEVDLAKLKTSVFAAQ